MLIGPRTSAEDRNDDCLGRVLDGLPRRCDADIRAGRKLSLRVMAIVTRFAHVDSSAFGLEGVYVGRGDAGADVQQRSGVNNHWQTDPYIGAPLESFRRRGV